MRSLEHISERIHAARKAQVEIKRMGPVGLEKDKMEKMKDFSGLFSSQGGSHQVVQVKYKERADK